MDRELIDVIHATIGAKRNYTLMDVHTAVSALLDALVEDADLSE